jgi:hypothetical protein
MRLGRSMSSSTMSIYRNVFHRFRLPSWSERQRSALSFIYVLQFVLIHDIEHAYPFYGRRNHNMVLNTKPCCDRLYISCMSTAHSYFVHKIEE